MAKKAIKAAEYIRMSSSKQEASPDQQRIEIQKLAKRDGYKIIRRYSDEAISGAEAEKRKGFQKLIADASNGDFEVILCWDQDRFSRFDPIEANYYWHILNKAGVRIVTVCQGELNFADLGGWLTASITQYGKAQYLRDLSKNICRGLRKSRMDGQWTGNPPIGYRVGPNKRLVFGPPEEVAIVEEIYRMRVAGYGYFAIARHLNKSGFKPPRVDLWNGQTIRHILHRKTYRGISEIGIHSRARYNRLSDEPIVVKDAHPRIIDDETWQIVQKMRNTRKSSYTRNGSEGAPLAGLLRCGNCGGKMYASTMYKRWGYYVCGTYTKKAGCHCYRIGQEVILNAVAQVIREKLLMGGVGRLEAEIRKQLKNRAKNTGLPNDTIQRRIADLDKRIAKATERLIMVDDSLMPDIEARILRMKQERDELEAKEHQSNERIKLDPKELAKKAWHLDEILRNARPSMVRNTLSRIIDHIKLDFEECGGTAKKKKYRCKSAIIQLISTEENSIPPISC